MPTNRHLKPASSHDPLWIKGLLVLLFLVPLPFGCNRPWASDLLGILSACLAIIFCWQNTVNPPRFHGTPPYKRLGISALLMILVVVWAFVQTSSLTPSSWQHPLWHLASDITMRTTGAISVAPDTNQESLIRLLSYAVCFALSFFAAIDENRARKILKTFYYAVIAYALYGIVMQLAGATHILWFRKWAYEGFLTSTFVNKNSCATYLGLGFLCALSLLWAHIKHALSKDQALSHKSAFAAWLKNFSLKDILYCLAPFLLLGALVLTGSRAGLASTVIGTIVLASGLAINRRWSVGGWMGMIGLVIALSVGAVTLNGETIVTRSEGALFNQDAQARLSAYRLAEQAISDNPLLGLGLGTFDNSFRLYRDSTLSLWFQHAHNDYLEGALEMGLPAFSAYLLAIGLMQSCCLAGIWLRRRHEIYPILATAATALVGSHAFTDFSLQIPAIAVSYAALLGVGVAQSWSSVRADESRANPQALPRSARPSPPHEQPRGSRAKPPAKA